MREERSPENEAMLSSDCQIFEQLKRGGRTVRFEERGPTSSLSGGYSLYKIEQQKIDRKVQTHTSFFGGHRAIASRNPTNDVIQHTFICGISRALLANSTICPKIVSCQLFFASVSANSRLHIIIYDIKQLSDLLTAFLLFVLFSRA